MFRDFRRTISLKSALTLLVLASLSPAVQPCFARYAPQLKRVVVSEKPTLDLIEKLGRQPELLSSDYLQYILGRPAKRNVSDSSNVVYHWITNPGGIGSQDCELFETRDANHRIVKACFKVNLPRSTTTITDIEKKINGDNDMLAANNAPMPTQRPPIVPLAAPPAGSLSAAAPPTASASPTAPNPTGLLATADPVNSLGSLDPFGPAIGSTSGAGSPAGSMTPGSLAPTVLPLASPSSISQAPTGSNYSGRSANQSTTQAGPRPAVKRLFDQQCRPSLQYSFVPYTNVFYMQAPNTFHVHHAEIVYAGPPLPPPSQADIADAASGMRARALGHHTKDSHGLAIPMLSDHLIDNPADAEAHYALGLSYQKSSNLNAAISEYQLALRYSNGDTTIANKATQSLQQLHVIPAPDDQFAFHTLRFKQNGQGLTEGDVIATQDRQSLIAGRTPLSSNNAPPIAGQNQYSGYGQPAGMSNGMSSPSYASYQPQSRLPVPSQPYQQSNTAPHAVSYTPYNASYAGSRADSVPAPSFYDSMNYGSNLFPASASYPNLEPGF